jgi:hypothetical protein
MDELDQILLEMIEEEKRSVQMIGFCFVLLSLLILGVTIWIFLLQ